MNRRTFALGLSAGMALFAPAVYAQRQASDTVFTSELTGAEIDLGDTGIEFDEHQVTPENDFERFQFALNGGLINIIFLERATRDAVEYYKDSYAQAEDGFPDFEELGGDEFDDGGWAAFSHVTDGTTFLHYDEYQLGAFPDHDVVIMSAMPTDTYDESLELLQSISLEGMPPFLFTEDSAIETIALEMQTSTTTTTGSSRGKSGRSSSGSGSESRSGQTGAGSESDGAEQVATHRVTFEDSFTEFYANLELAGDATTTQQERDDAWDNMVTEAEAWQLYAEEAAEVTFGPNDADLEEAYLYWADCVVTLGDEFLVYYEDFSSTDAFLAAYDDVLTADEDLEAILAEYGLSTRVHLLSCPVISARLIPVHGRQIIAA